MEIRQHLFCELPVVPVRSEASDRAELVTQLLFGDTAVLLQVSENEKWWKIKADADGYEGWVDTKQLLKLTVEQHAHVSKADVLLAGAATFVTYADGALLRLPLGCFLPRTEGNKLILGKNTYTFTGDRHVPVHGLDSALLTGLHAGFYRSPYLWGGKTSWGIDCSGFVQILYRFFSIYLPRDAWQQAEFLNASETPQEIEKGDLLFFRNDGGKVIHVGVALENNTVIHAHGRVRIDTYDLEGILNSDTGLYSHRRMLMGKIKSIA